MRDWSPDRVAQAAGARLAAPAPHAAGPARVVIDSRDVGAGDLFVGLTGGNVDGGRFAPQALAGGAWGVLVGPEHADAARCAPPGVLLAARPLTGGPLNAGRVIVVFGAGGDRDRAKRPLMGAVACDLADVVIVTSDNPRSEDPEAIIGAILEGAGAGVAVEVDRRAAIERAIDVAGDGDIVVIAGKGHEQGQEFEDGRKEPFDDTQVAREAIANYVA